MKTLMVMGLVLMLAGSAWAAPHWEADLSFTPVAPLVQTGFRIDVKMGLTGTYATLTNLNAAATSYHDVGPYQDGQVVCWRVMALPQNPNGSNVGAETCLGAPVQYPGKVGAPTVNWQFLPN